jgi:hypothetical protein
MSNGPDFLPQMIAMPGSWDEILAVLYQAFEADFKRHRTMHEGLLVLYDGRILRDGEGKEEGFWHVISRSDRHTGERLIDYPRAQRLSWARALLESPPRSEIKVFDFDEGPKDTGIRRYIWLEASDYALVLQRKKQVYHWVTAFCVTSNWKRTDLRKRYENRV